jgi:IS30 family transposase
MFWKSWKKNGRLKKYPKAQKGVFLGYDNANLTWGDLAAGMLRDQYIYVLPRGELKQTLIKALRQEHKYRRTKKSQKPEENRGKISNMSSIEERPADGLIRQYFPKGTDFTQVSEDEIIEVQRKLNDQPRKALSFYKHNEVFNSVVALIV